MAIDTDRLVQIATELKTLDEHRETLLRELGRIAQGIGGRTSVVGPRRRGRPPRSLAPAAARAPAKRAAPAPRSKRRSGITSAIVDFLNSGGGAYTAGEILAGLDLPKSKSRLTTISTTLVRLAKEGRAKKDKQRGYRVI